MAGDSDGFKRKRDDLESTREELERRLRMLHSAGNRDRAATVVLESYGPEIYAFLVAVHGNEFDAEDVFALFAEGFWQALETFAGNCSFRTFAYAIARRLSYRYRRDAARKRKRAHALDTSMMSRLAHEVRSRTSPYLITETKSRLMALRSRLSPEEQELLMLRVDRNLQWEELVDVLRGDEEDAPPLTPEMRKKESARLRKQFQHLKEKLRAMARAEGLLGDKE